ncbi:MAG: transketolase [Gammaproteobacteria bacterium]|nr:transketolase [Gammaproteobacteria bacterium]
MSQQFELANCLRFLAIDSVQKANSGHPGMPMGMADIATVLWREFLRHNPKDPNWLDRDRFVLSNGHGSMLLYALLHLTGYNVALEDLKNFRQLDSITPGHPEVLDTDGVETTTGPLGQGLANAVGMALAEKLLAAKFNQDKFNVIDHFTYVFAGDGCLMEGISHEAASLAGIWKLGKLILFWDDNEISIDGSTKNWFGDDTASRFEAYNWHVIRDIDGHNPDHIRQAIKTAQLVDDQPTLICCKTTIGFGSPHLADTSKVHGSPLGEDEVALTRKELNWKHAPFVIPQELRSAWTAIEQGKKLQKEWTDLYASYQDKYQELADELTRRLAGNLPDNWTQVVDAFLEELEDCTSDVATRKASQMALDAYAPHLPELLGGSADLTGSNLTKWHGSIDIMENLQGNYVHYGVREFGMSAIMNGVALHGGFIPYGGTFLVFADYARNAIRMAALMEQRVVFVLTHDSIGLGEDGPTHQPIEHLAMLRATPNVAVWRPCDAVETAVAWSAAIEHKDGPSCLALSRQKLPALPHEHNEDIKRGGYILLEPSSEPDAVVIATGSETAIAYEAVKEVNAKGRAVRLVSMPCCELFDKQDIEYQESVLPQKITKRLAIEAAASQSWYKYVGLQGKIIGIDSFGKSAPDTELYQYFGLTKEHVIKALF